MKIVLFLSLIFSIQAAYANSCFSEVGVESTQDDPFYKERRAQVGKYKGECYNNGFRRNSPRFDPLNVVHQDLISRLYNIEMKRGKVYFANFRHDNEFYLAEYTPGSVSRILMMFEKFIEPLNNVVLTGHTHLRFLLKEPIRLYHPRKGMVAEVSDFNYAMFAVRPMSIKDQAFSPFGDGIKKNYAITHNFMSTLDMAFEYENYAMPDSTAVSQFELESFGLDFEKTLNALITFSHQSYHEKNLRPYHTLKNNCVSNMYVGIVNGDKGLRRAHDNYHGKIYEKDGEKFFTPRKPRKKFTKNPMWVLRDLASRGMIMSRTKNQREDFNSDLCTVLENANRALPKGCQ